MIFVNYPGHLIALLLVIFSGVLVFLAFHSNELRKAKLKRYRLLLALLQYISIFILLLILCNPSRPKVEEIETKNSVVALFDTSESMSIVEDGKITRLDRAIDIFNKKFNLSVPDGPDYEFFGFDRNLYQSYSPDFLRRWGSQTNMHGIFTMLQKYGFTDKDNLSKENPADGFRESDEIEENREGNKNRVTGAVIFTDGQADDKDINSYLSFVGDDFKVLLVGIGSRKPQSDIVIKSINAPSRVAIDTAYKVQVTVSVKNIQDQPVTIELLKDNFMVDSRQLPADMFTQKGKKESSSIITEDVTLDFTLGAESLGNYILSAQAKAFEQEVNPANNVRSTMVEVVEETRLKVLFYSQWANFNIGKVRQALARDEKIQLDLAFDVVRAPMLSEEAYERSSYVKLPEDREGFNKYDVIVLGSCNLDSLTVTQIDSLYSFVVDRGGGLILLPGKDESGPAAWMNKKAKDILPVVFNSGGLSSEQYITGKIELTLEGIDSKVIDSEMLDEYDQSTSAYYQVINTKPAASTLASVETKPIISVHRIGRGRVCLLNVSKLFLLYREDLEGGLLNKLMAGLTSYIGRVKNLEAGVRLFAERLADQPDKVKFSAYVCDKSFKPVTGANVLLNIADDFSTMKELGGGYYTTEIKNAKDQTVVATAQAEINGIFLGEKTIAVNPQPVKSEMEDVEFDETFLKALAKKLNGRYYYTEDVDEDVKQIFKAYTRQNSSQRMASIWPNWFLLLILCGILSFNWFLRRAVGLV
ncbi:MAG: hypothetical protein JW837_13980 [Sedimentisphaerales bacterium]|nr:hypothetical protein [Sedimentisphaerales bacterium]